MANNELKWVPEWTCEWSFLFFSIQVPVRNFEDPFLKARSRMCVWTSSLQYIQSAGKKKKKHLCGQTLFMQNLYNNFITVPAMKMRKKPNDDVWPQQITGDLLVQLLMFSTWLLSILGRAVTTQGLGRLSTPGNHVKPSGICFQPSKKYT